MDLEASIARKQAILEQYAAKAREWQSKIEDAQRLQVKALDRSFRTPRVAGQGGLAGAEPAAGDEMDDDDGSIEGDSIMDELMDMS